MAAMRSAVLLLSVWLGVYALVDAQPVITALTGATLIDGNGGAVVTDAVVILAGDRIEHAGPRGSLRIPAGARIIDAAGKFIIPGLVDTNVHLSLYGGVGDRYETLAKYHSRQQAIVLEAAQLQLKHGVTTVRDSYGLLTPLVAVREQIKTGAAIGPRILAAGNIVGWGGPYSVSFSLIREQGLTLFQEQMNDEVSQGAGEDLVDMDLDELRSAIRAYLDKGPDFIKFGGTAHFARPAFIGFSSEAQQIIVEEAHARNRVAETHATTVDGLRMSIEAGIDLVQHPEILGLKEMPDALVKMIVDRGVVCSMLSNTITGEAWTKAMKDRDAAMAKRAESEKAQQPQRPRTGAELRQRALDEAVELRMRRRNAEKLIAAGAVVTIGTDNYWAAAPEFTRGGAKPDTQNHGIGSIIAIEGLVELGMTPERAIVAATKNGAIASRGLTEFGTIEKGKRADLVLLDADPLSDIRNLRRISMVFRDGRSIDHHALPAVRVLSR